MYAFKAHYTPKGASQDFTVAKSKQPHCRLLYILFVVLLFASKLNFQHAIGVVFVIVDGVTGKVLF